MNKQINSLILFPNIILKQKCPYNIKNKHHNCLIFSKLEI